MPDNQGTQDVTSELAMGLLGKSPVAPQQPTLRQPEGVAPGTNEETAQNVNAVDPSTEQFLNAQLSALKSESEAQINGLGQHLQSLSAMVQQLVEAKEENATRLDPEALKEMSMGEAMAAMAQSLEGKTERNIKSLLRPFVGDLLNLKVSNDVLLAERMFPNLDLSRHVNKIRNERISNPEASIEDLVKKVVSPAELEAARPKTPAPQNDVHFESGPSAATPGSSARGGQSQQRGYSAQDQNVLLRALDAANKNGDVNGADQYASALLADRLMKSGVIQSP